MKNTFFSVAIAATVLSLAACKETAPQATSETALESSETTIEVIENAPTMEVEGTEEIQTEVTGEVEATTPAIDEQN
ncbi:hypothetical protein [Dokdonia sinensis]|nr:hypothetical protein [Dokdonia sinensis]